MSAVVLPAASAAFTSTQVIFSNSTRSACARGAARADPAASIREVVPPAINISKECETEPMRMSFSFPHKHKLAAVLTENRQFYKFIIITIIVPSAHDSVDLLWHADTRPFDQFIHRLRAEHPASIA